MASRQENWTAFLYILLRDHVPLGKVAEIVQELEAHPARAIKFTNNGCHHSAQDFMQRIDAL